MVGLMNHWLPEHHRHPPLSAPVSRHSHKINFYLGIVLVVFMAVSVVALFCICYHLEWRLRLQARNVARRVSRGNGFSVQDAGCSQDMIGARVGNRIKQETSLSVMMPGDSIPSFLAKAKPHGSPTDPHFSDSLGAETFWEAVCRKYSI
ncbi:uncharacterized protein [Physcomitrium patens]|uniref:Uncharacterized protein n=1 Tax=Physcomitrium patens TaxID=3218 RepID=A0A7I4F9Q0_PHYPA|nr:uncharacterized protein LOC112295863 isoform X2 [Physcomitrium patens]|eukprot:XP_024403649.1 uncharacterized protein LOC112295863 isoform X2 [Physcomitrella patens]